MSRNAYPKALGSIPWRGRVRNRFLSLQVNACADLFVPDLPSECMHAPKCVCTLKILYSSVVRVRLTDGGMKTLHIGKKLGIAVLWLLTFPRKSSPNCPCVGLGQESYLS